MKRFAGLGLAIAVLGVAAAVLIGSGGTQSAYRVDVVFDDSRGLVPGQLLEIAGGRAGTITAVRLTAGFHRALVELEVDPRFAPFRSTATCTIRPQGLIAENYVACDPGDPSGRPLTAHGSTPPTVPVTHTTEPVTLTDLFNIATVPTRDRFRVLLDELGIGAAARGQDINGILRRANPSLALANRAIAILLSQRQALAQTIDATDPVVAELASHRAQARAFLGAAANASTEIAAHRPALAASVARLPPLLEATRPALAQLDTVVTQTTPLLIQLKDTAPIVVRLSADLVPLVAASRPALSQLGHALRYGAAVAPKLVPVTQALGNYARRSLPTAKLTDQLFANLEQTGFFANFLTFIYHAGAAMARFDGISHILPAHVSFSSCSNYASAPVPGCSADFGSGTATAAVRVNGRQAAMRALLRYLLR